MALKRTLSGHPFRGMLIGLNFWYAKILSANQDFSCQSLYYVIKYSLETD